MKNYSEKGLKKRKEERACLPEFFKKHIEIAKNKFCENVLTCYTHNNNAKLLNLLKLLTPFLPHTTHEAYAHLPHTKEENMYLENMPKYVELGNEDIITKYEAFMEVRDNVLKALEEARNNKVIGKSFNAKLTLYPENEVKELLESMNANLQQIFIVSRFEIKDKNK